MFNNSQRALLSLHKFRYLKPGSSESDEPVIQFPNSSDDEQVTSKKMCKLLDNYITKQDIDKKIWQNALLPPKAETNDF